jgi:hypothetical protein
VKQHRIKIYFANPSFLPSHIYFLLNIWKYVPHLTPQRGFPDFVKVLCMHVCVCGLCGGSVFACVYMCVGCVCVCGLCGGSVFACVCMCVGCVCVCGLCGGSVFACVCICGVCVCVCAMSTQWEPQLLFCNPAALSALIDHSALRISILLLAEHLLCRPSSYFE